MITRRRTGAGELHEKAFTLIEVVLAVVIMGTMLTLLYQSLTQLLQMKFVLDDRRDASAITDAVLGRLSRELQLAYANTALMPPRDTPDKRSPPRLYLLGEEKLLDNGQHGDSISFLALEGGQYLPDAGTHTGLVQITYRVEKDPDNPDSKTYYLVREETPYKRPFEKAFKQTMVFPITTDLIGLEFTYLSRNGDADEWTSSWGDDQHQNLPEMVKFKFGIRSPEGREQWFVTAVALRGEE